MGEQWVIEAGRREAEARMTSLCTVTRDGVKTWDPVALEYTDTDVTAYTGPCRIKSNTSTVADREQAGRIVVDQDQVLYLPVTGSEQVHVDDVVTITNGGPDTALTGRTFRVTGLFTQTWATARRLPIESITGDAA